MVITLLYAIFMLSGAAGLIYESIWTRYLGLFVGHSAYAQVIVLVIFLGGMSIGSYVIGRRTTQIERPLVWYAIVELIVGAIGLVFHQAFVGTTAGVYENVFPALGHGVLQTVAKWTIAALLILPQSILLGMTFPLMSAGVVRRMPSNSGRALSMLYFTNSLGAAMGVLIAGFWLVDSYGLPGTLIVAAMLNLVVALAVMVLVRLGHTAQASVAETNGPVDHSGLEPAGGQRWRPDRLWMMLIATSFITAVSSFIYEIGWIRMLSLVLGSATHSFELMLSAFILGLALGAWWIGRRVDAYADSLRLLGRVQIAMGALAIATLPVYLASFDWMARFISAFARTNEGYLAFSVGRYAICLAVMLPATICAGMTLPLITRALIKGAAGERAIGQVYAINTLGSIVGASLAGLVLMPLLGLKWLLIAGAVLDLAVGFALIAESARPVIFTPRRMILTAAVVAGLGAIVFRAKFDEATLSSGVYRHGNVRFRGGWPVLFHKDGRTATVTVRRVESSRIMTLLTNGKSDASIGPRAAVPGPLGLDMPTQLFTPLLPLAYAPYAKEVAVIGHGSGLTTHAILGSPHLRQVTTIEIEPVMIEAAEMFKPANRRAYDDPRSVFVIDDARAYFASSQKTFDIIVAEPSNPWVSGVSGLFTSEFYARAKSRLSPNGVFAQWMHTYEISDDLVLSVLGALDENFQDWIVYATSGQDLLIVAAEKLPAPHWEVMQYPGVAEDLGITWPVTATTLERMRIADRKALTPLLRRLNSANSDFYPTVDLYAERTRFMQTSASGLFDLMSGLNLPGMVRGQREGLGDPYAIIPAIPRLRQMSVNSGMRTGDPRAGVEASIAAQEVRSFDGELGGGNGPSDWRAWVRRFSDVAALRHGGTSGVIDTVFFARVKAYLDRHRAPAEVRSSVEFHEAILGWDYGRAAVVADPLIRLAARGDFWIDPDFLRDGAVMALLRTGDRAAARDAFRALELRSTRPANDLRNQLLLSYVLDSAQTISRLR
jgi:predicted membrane-bound spermidine synthase